MESDLEAEAASPSGEHPPAWGGVRDAGHRMLSRWRENVGDPIAFDAGSPDGDVSGVDVVVWNVAIGAGRIEALLDRLGRGVASGPPRASGRPLVLLLQEAYRADPSVPVHAPHPRWTGGDLTPSSPEDIVDLARNAGMSLRYAPSMRNGAAPSDRGNAVLASAPLARADAFTLLHIHQRRVAVAAELAELPGVRFTSVHLDTQRRMGPSDSPARVPGRARAEQAGALARALIERGGGSAELVVGGDFNTPLGRRDPAYGAMLAGGFAEVARAGSWRHTYHAPLWRLELDHAFHRGGGRVARIQVARVDEHPRDRGARIFGSDHHPLLVQLELKPGAPR